jgi:isoleucyl-tRNA synthetase
LFVKAADPVIIDHLRSTGLLWRADRTAHSYPHCWRCGTPLLYYARSSWFVRTTAVRDLMLKRNARVGWHPPETGAGRFGEWLAGNIDWAISRDRYWGTPLPVWVCDVDASHVEAIDGFATLAARVGTALPADFDPHKPHVDQYRWPCRACQTAGRAGTMRRVSEVIDAWFDSGSMPFAQWHYPFENRDQVARQFPADFVAEGVDQTRGWFYSLLAIATALGDVLPNNGEDQTAPFRSVVVNDLVLDAQGQKMSKSRGNSVDPWKVIDEHGADAIRFFLIESSQVWVPRRFDEQAIRDSAGRLLITLKNMYDGIFVQYANFGWAPSPLDPPVANRPPVDQWVLSRLAHVEREADAYLERYEPTLAARVVRQFIDDDVSKWYVRLTRSRYYDVEAPESRAAFATLHEVLTVVARLLAPIMPFVTDWLHRELVGTSVHLAPYVRERGAGAVNDALEGAMTDIRRLATLAHAAREEAKIKTRQPLSRLVCVVPRIAGRSGGLAELQLLAPLLQAELNVKAVEWLSSGDSLVTLSAKANFRTLGKKFGKQTPEAAQAVERLTNEQLRDFERGVALSITVGGQTQAVDQEDIRVTHATAGELVVQEGDGYLAAIDPRVTPELAAEGLARELISAIQRTRKEAGLAVSDRIRVLVVGVPTVTAAVGAHRDWIMREVLARDLTIGEPSMLAPPEGSTREASGTGTQNRIDGFDAVRTLDLDGLSARISITREVET